MANILIYVDPDASGNNDGTSYPNAYTDLKFGVDQRKTNLVGTGDSHIYLCRSSAGTQNLVTASIGIRDYVTSPTETVKIIMDTGQGYHFGKWDPLQYRVVAGASTIIFNARGEDFTLSGLQIDFTAVTGTTACIQQQLSGDVHNESLLENLLLKSDTQDGRGILINNLGTDPNTVCRLQNIIGWGGVNTIRVTASAGANYFIDNCTVDGAGADAFYVRTGATVRVRNCVAMRSPDGFDQTAVHTDSTNNASDANDAPGLLPIDLTGIDITTLFVAPNASPPDFHILPGTVLENGGTDLTGVVDEDIDLETRSVPYSIGADQIVSGEQYDFTVNDVTTGAVTVEEPTLTHFNQEFLPGDVNTGAVTVGEPSVGTTHPLAVADLNTGAVTITSPTLSETEDITPSDVSTGAVSITPTTVGSTHNLDVDDLSTSAVTIDAPGLTQTHPFVVVDLSTGAVLISKPAVSTEGALFPQFVVTGQVTIDQPTLTHFNQEFQVGDVTTGAVSISSPSINPPTRTEYIRGSGRFLKTVATTGKFIKTVSGKGTLLEDPYDPDS